MDEPQPPPPVALMPPPPPPLSAPLMPVALTMPSASAVPQGGQLAKVAEAPPSAATDEWEEGAAEHHFDFSDVKVAQIPLDGPDAPKDGNYAFVVKACVVRGVAGLGLDPGLVPHGHRERNSSHFFKVACRAWNLHGGIRSLWPPETQEPRMAARPASCG